jgi:hypothetical protein
MPAVRNRETVEQRVARTLGKVNRQAFERIQELLGDPPKAHNLTPEAWQEIQGMYDQAMLPQLEKVFHDAAQDMIEHVGGGVEWDLINNRAADWARQSTLNLVRGLTDNSKQIIQSGLDDFYNQRLTLGALEERLARTFGPVRAESIAITETTRAAAQGELAYADELRKQGAVLVAVWETENDETVCPICSPLNGKDQGDGWNDPPPAHPRCRCNQRFRVVLPDEL